LAFYGNQGGDGASQNDDLDRQSNENAYNNRPMTSDNMAGTMADGFRGRRPANNLDKANSQASLESDPPGNAEYQMGVVDIDDASASRKDKGDKKKKKKKDKDKKREKSEPAPGMRRNDSNPAMADDQNSYERDELDNAYDKNS